jgi:adhesin/invasin
MKAPMINLWITLFLSCAVLFSLSCSNEDILAPNSATLSLIANPTSIPADGSSTSTIEVILQDTNGNALNGYTIYFTTTLGTITDKATIEDGIAHATLTAGDKEGTATITAFSGSLSDSVQVFIGFQDVNILLTANPPEIPADGVSTSEIDAFVTEQRGVVPDGTDVFFTTTRGTITSQAQTHNGLASATLTSGIVEGTATVSAIVRNTSQTTDVSVGIPVSNITLTANPSTFYVDDAVTHDYVSNITVTVWDAAGVPIENKAVVITSDLGQLDSAGAIQKTDVNGQVTDTLRITIAVPLGTSQSVTVTATSGAISTSITITITNTG